MAVTMYHGNAAELALHVGLSLAENVDIARDYAVYDSFGPRRYVHTVAVELDGLRVVQVDGYDRDENVAPGDSEQDYDADVIVFADETIRGRPHTTYRLMSPAALAAVTVVAAIDAEQI